MRFALPFSRATRTAVVSAVAMCALVACGTGSSEDDSAPPAESSDISPAAALPECKAAFPAAFGEADIAEAQLLPANWPPPPAGATLCQTSETVDGSREDVDYATELTADEVYAAYEEALDPSFGVKRETSGIGAEILVGVADGVNFQIAAAEGKFTIGLAK